MTDTPRSHPDTTTPHQAQTPATDNQCQQPPTKRARNQQSIVRDAAAAAARYLSSLGHGQLSSHRRVITYNTIEPLHCCDGWGASTPRLRCTYTALASLRGILNTILDQEVSTATWSELTQVGGSSGTWRPGEDSSTLRMPCWNTLDTHLVAEATGEARGRAMVETLTALLEDVDRLPVHSLAATQEAAMRLVRRIAEPRKYPKKPQESGKRQRCGGCWTDTMGSAT